jgi:MarR family 2-MHQ and catechol resistance regulon transcriptional repressor
MSQKQQKPGQQKPDFCDEVSVVINSLLSWCERRERLLMTEAGVTSVELRALKAVGSGKLPMRKLARQLELSPSRVTRVVDSLSRKQMIRREQCPDDRRLCKVSLSQQGQEAMARGEQVGRSFHEQAASKLSEEEKERILAALNRFISLIQGG